MVDREEVLKGLEHHRHLEASRNELSHDECFDCPYRPDGEDTCASLDRMIDDVLELLKEQEAVPPEVEVLNEIDRLYRCPKCHKYFFYEKQKYCVQCGQAVKWNETD